MGRTADQTHPIFRLRPLTMALLMLCLAAFAAFMAVAYQQRPDHGWNPSDFDIFHLAGQTVWLGSFGDAYRSEAFFALQSETSTVPSTMPWTYPPQFGLVAATLAVLPVWLAYLVFTSASLGAYLLLLRRIAGPHFPTLVLTLLPVLMVGIWTGQNGFLTGSLVGLFALLALRGSARAGLPLGLMVIKPHLAVGLGILLLLSRRWGWLVQAVGVTAGTALLATLAFGAGIWPAFLDGVRESKALLAEGSYSLHRMTSAYSVLRSLDIDAQVALGLHLGLALCGLAMVQVVVVRRWQLRRVLAVATLSSQMVSPYIYDYDMTLLGVALALAAPDFAAVARRLFPLALVLTWFACLYAYASGWATYRRYLDQAGVGWEERPPALSGLAVLALIVLLLAVMHRAQRGEEGSRPRQPSLAGAAGP